MTDVVLLSIDSLRADHVTEDAFSNCWETFSSDFARFTDAYANGVATGLSFPSIHTGRHVRGDGSLDPESPTIAELFDGETFGISNNPHLRSDRGYDRGFDYFTRNRGEGKLSNAEPSLVDNIKTTLARSDVLDRTYHLITDAIDDATPPDFTPRDERTAGYLLSELRDAMTTQTGFFWIHFNDVHYPFTPHGVLDRDVPVDVSNEQIEDIITQYKHADEGRSYTDPVLGSVEDDLNFLREMYAELVGYVDRRFAEFFKWLDSRDRWDETMIVVMSDHGEAFGEQGVFNHDWTAEPIDPLVRVPLLVKYPGNQHAGSTFDHPVQNADLLATLADELGWDVSPPAHTRPFTEPGTRPIVSKSNTAVRVTTDKGYAIQTADGTKVVGDVPDEALKALKESSIPDVVSQPSDISSMSATEQEELEARLEQMGYT